MWLPLIVDGPDATLLATIAGATSALVAIVGGLLVSRFVTLHAEQQAAARRLANLGARADEVRSETDELRSELARMEAADFFCNAKVLQHIVENGYGSSIEDLVGAAGDASVLDLPDDVMGHERALIEDGLREAFERLSSEVGVEADDEDWDACRYRLALSPKRAFVWKWTYAYLSDRLHRERQVQKEGGSLYDAIDYRIPLLERTTLFHVPVGAMNDRFSRINAGDSALASLASEQRLAAEALDATKQPEGFPLALRVLALVALLGIFCPLVVLAFDSGSLGVFARIGTVAGFAVALILLYGYMATYARHLAAGGNGRFPSTVRVLARAFISKR